MKKPVLLPILLMISLCMYNFAFADEVAINKIFTQRHSGKMYDPSRIVSMEQIYSMIEAARWAPSSHNEQPWNFIICERTLTPEAYLKAFSSLKAETQQKWAVDAPLLIVVVARSIEIKKKKFNPWHEYDTGAAALSLALQAADLGLMAHQIGGFNKEIICREFHLPEDCHPLTIMVIGYEIEEDKPLPRERKPVESNFFLGQWGLGIIP